MTVLEQIGAAKIVAIVRLDDLSIAAALTDALIAGGIRVIEFTLTNPQAGAVITAMRQRVPSGVIIGAGSVLQARQVREVARAGAQFVVSPVCKRDVILACQAQGLPAMPGAFSPSEIQQAWEWGASVVKVFPASHLGKGYIKDLLAPLPHLRLMPTGGIHAGNMRELLDMGAYALGVGSALINHAAVADRDWARLEADARRFVAQLLG